MTSGCARDLSQIWIKFYLEEKDYAKGNSFIRYMDSTIDEETSRYLTFKADASIMTNKMEVFRGALKLNDEQYEL